MKVVGRVSLAKVRDEGLVRLEYPPFDVVIGLVDGVPCAVEDACNHSGASLAEGSLDGERLVCPMHGYVFSIRTGALLAPRGLCGDQRRFEIRVEGDDLIVLDPADIVVG
jgi:nitrite reductase/ring-hydroxylating ferredoxin subunit